MTFDEPDASVPHAHRSAVDIGQSSSEDPGTSRASLLIDQALESLAMPGVHLASRIISAGDVSSLHPAEWAAIASSVASRRAEFAAGRLLLRSLLGHDVTIPVGADRAPILPEGVHASLAHDRTFAVAALSRSSTVRSIGIDIEPMTKLSSDMAAIILRDDDGQVDAHLAFTLKEATYKAWSRLGGRMLDFQDVRLEVGVKTFIAEVVHDGTRFSGRFVNGADRWIALVVVAHPSA